jgi:hypothetical protein
MEEVHGDARDVRSIAQAVDEAIVIGPLAPVIGQEFVGVQSVGFDWHSLVKILGVGQDARRDRKPADEGPVEIYDIENVILNLVRIDGDGPLDLFDGPPVNIEGTVQDDLGTENLAQGFAKVPKLAGVLGLKVSELVESPDAGQAGLDEARVAGTLARQGQGTHRFHSGSMERSQ